MHYFIVPFLDRDYEVDVALFDSEDGPVVRAIVHLPNGKVVESEPHYVMSPVTVKAERGVFQVNVERGEEDSYE